MKPLSKTSPTIESRPRPAAARLYASTAPGPGRCPGSKVRTSFEDAHRIRKVRILENPDVFFEDAHPFPRCARKTAHLRERRSERGSRPKQWWRDFTGQRHRVQGGALAASAAIQHSGRRRRFYEILRRHERFQLQGVERVVLPGKNAAQADAGLLRRAFFRLRNEQHALPHADVGPVGVVGGRGAGELSIRSQGAAADYAFQTAERGRRADGSLFERGRGFAEKTRAAAVPVASELQERCAAAGEFFGPAQGWAAGGL